MARNNNGTYSYEYMLTDHLGNNRATFHNLPGVGIEVMQKDDYFAFGLRKEVLRGSNDNKYLYNKKELQEELGEYDYGARFYDPVIGRWNTVDRMSEYHFEANPYNYVLNNPMIYIDPYGLDTLKANNIRPIDWQNFKPKADVITLENVGITASRKNSNDNSGIYLGVLGLGVGQAENTLFNKETWYSLRAMKSYSQSFHGNQYEWTKGISKKLSVGLKIGGYAMGAYSIRKVNQEYNDGTIQYNGRPMSRESMLTEQASGLFSTVGGVAGAAGVLDGK